MHGGLESPLIDTPVRQPSGKTLPGTQLQLEICLYSQSFLPSAWSNWKLETNGYLVHTSCPWAKQGTTQQHDGRLRQPLPPLGITLDTNTLLREKHFLQLSLKTEVRVEWVTICLQLLDHSPGVPSWDCSEVGSRNKR